MRLRNRRAFLSSLLAVCLLAVSATAALAAAPVITSLSATSGHVGQNVTINGSGFGGFAAGQVQVLFHGGVSAAFTINSDTRITATVPGGATSGKISVVTPSGTAIAPKSYKVKAASLKLTGFCPLTAPLGADHRHHRHRLHQRRRRRRSAPPRWSKAPASRSSPTPRSTPSSPPAPPPGGSS